MRYWTLGTSAAAATAERDNSSVLVRAGGEAFLLDCSGSPVHRLARVGCDFLGLSAVVITHRHTDHLYGLPSLVHSLMIGRPDRDRLPIFGPPEAIRVALDLLSAFWPDGKFLRFASLDEAPLEPNHLLYESAGVQIFVSPVEHGPETLAVKVVERRTGAALVYSSDTTPCENLVELAFGADDLVHDSTFCTEGSAHAGADDHSTAREAGLAAKRAGVKRLILVHFRGAGLDVGECVKQAASEFDGVIVAASDFEEFVCGSCGDG